MANLNIGPDGVLLVYSVVVSILLAVLCWRRVRLTAVIVTTLTAMAAFVVVMLSTLDAAEPTRQVVSASFIVVPSLLLLGATRAPLVARQAWLLVLLGPITFIGCYIGICDVCVHLRLI